MFHIMGYNLKSARNSKMSKFEFLENFEDLHGKCSWRRSCYPTTFSMQIFLFFVQTVIKSNFLMKGASNLAILIFSTFFFPFLAFVKF